MMTLLSQSETDIPARRAASSAVSRASGRRPFTFHGTPDFMLTSAHGRGAGFQPLSNRHVLNERGYRRGPVPSQPTFAGQGKHSVKTVPNPGVAAEIVPELPRRPAAG